MNLHDTLEALINSGIPHDTAWKLAFYGNRRSGLDRRANDRRTNDTKNSNLHSMQTEDITR